MFSFLRKVKEANRPRCTALVAAAGASSRMEGVNKVLEPLEGVPVLARTLVSFQLAEEIDEIVVAAREEDLVEISRMCRTYDITKCTKVVRGGESRVHSVLLAALEASPDSALLAVQDGARPLVTPELIGRVVSAAARCGAAAPAVAVKDTVKTVRADGAVERTLERETLRAVQTPQVFEASLLKAALQSALESGAPVTDDCSAVERLGKVAFLVEGEEENLKITTPMDLILAEAILRAREAGQ
nr:2-C-methyl-D-erythritol 4-phosphate cytidylyltransferase [uncultured Oscillibacter sp.]